MTFSSFDGFDGTSIVFDLDGTLVDTAPDVFRATNRTLAANGFATMDPAIMRTLISHGARRILIEALAGQSVVVDDDEISRLEAALLADYAENIVVDSVIYPGAVETLTQLAERGALLSVCTNKKHTLAVALLDTLDLSRFFRAVTGRDSLGVQKPHPDHLLRTIDLGGGKRDRAVMIGDSEVDVATAQAAGVPVVAVSYGYSKMPAGELGADEVIDAFPTLPEAIAACLVRG